ncbi:MAG TPA: hypothetical protein VFG35_13610, partial [Actinoplanes sp.]|nr:hypothetical protein [Actinoplanes sp.]
MSIDTRLDGDPGSIRASADWLGKQLSAAVDQTVTDLFAVRDQAETGWRGDAGPAFHGKMDTSGRSVDNLRADVDSVAGAFNSYADDLTTAQAGMDRARGIAIDGGLELQGTTILDPGAGPTVPAAPPTTATAEQVQGYNAQVTAYHTHQTKLTAYAQAQGQATWTREIGDFAKDTLNNVIGDLKAKPVIVAAGFANEGVIGALAAKHVGILKGQAQAFREESETAKARYLKASGGSPEAKALNLESYNKYLEADKWERTAARTGSKIEARACRSLDSRSPPSTSATTFTRANPPARRSSAVSAAPWTPPTTVCRRVPGTRSRAGSPPSVTAWKMPVTPLATPPRKSGTPSSDRLRRGGRDMMPNQDPPAGWPRPRRSAGRVASVAGFALLTLITAAVVAADVATGEAVQALIWAVAVLMFAHLAGMSASMLRRPAPSTQPLASGTTDEGESGLAFAYSRWPYYWLCAVLVAVALFAAGLAVVFAAQGTVAGWVLAAIFAAGALFLAWFLTVLLRLAPGVVVLTPSGIYHRGL